MAKKEINDTTDWIIAGILVMLGLLVLFFYFIILQGTNNFVALSVFILLLLIERAIREIRHKK